MDNELEIVTEVTDEVATKVAEKPSLLKTVGPIAGAFALGGLAGWAFTKWVISPILAKKAAKKSEEAAEDDKSEE